MTPARSRSHRRRADAGQVLPLVALLVALAAAAMVMIVHVGRTVDDRARASTAADAAALAGAADGRAAAAALAAENGGVLEEYRVEGVETVVVVRVGVARATARAAPAGAAPGPPGATSASSP